MFYARRDKLSIRGCAAHLVPCIFCWMMGLMVIACAPHTYTLTPNPTPYVRDDPTEYYLYLPSHYSPQQEWPVVVGVHGTGGSGRDCLSLWQAEAEQHDFILVCPSLADENGGWYQDKGEALLRQVLDHVAGECRIQTRVFLVGFSAGATFVQGYAFAYPDSVTGVASLSAGNYYEPDPHANGIPFLVVIGDHDQPLSLKNAKLFAEVLEQQGFSVELQVLSGQGHTVSAEARQLTMQLFQRLAK